jgi:hypothetical protein
VLVGIGGIGSCLRQNSELAHKVLLAQKDELTNASVHDEITVRSLSHCGYGLTADSRKAR